MAISHLWPKRTKPSLNSELSSDYSKTSAEKKRTTVLLTGSTGNLGAYILDDLLSRPEIRRVYCLNRSKDAESRQKVSHEARGLCVEFDSDRVKFLQADYTDENLGLDEKTYAELDEQVTVIVHNAWPVDFNRSLPSFTPSIQGISTLLHLSLSHSPSSPPPPSSPSPTSSRPYKSLLFTSSIGAASNWASHASTSRDLIPESELDEWKLARTGYGQSKLLAERLLAEAARNWPGLRIGVVRIGQMAGPVERGEKGAWPQREWVPSLIKSSVVLGAVPEDLGPHEAVDWVPVDVAARVLVEFAVGMEGKGDGGEAEFYHLSNPKLAKWADVLPAIRRYLPGDVRTVGFVEWVDLLKETMHDGKNGGGVVGDFKGADDDTNPAVKLWDMFIHMQDRAIRFPGSLLVTLDTKQSVKASPTLAALEPVNNDWMELWMRQWKLTAKG